MIKPIFGSCYGLIKHKWFSKLQFKSLRIKHELFEDYFQDTCSITKSNMIAFLEANALYDIKLSITECLVKTCVFVGEKENKAMHKRIVSANWIEMMTTSYLSCDENFGNQDYGFLSWLPHRINDSIAAIGDGGNIIYINRKNQIVVDITAHFKPMVFNRVEYIEKNVVKALITR